LWTSAQQFLQKHPDKWFLRSDIEYKLYGKNNASFRGQVRPVAYGKGQSAKCSAAFKSYTGAQAHSAVHKSSPGDLLFKKERTRFWMMYKGSPARSP
jgi:hypothetical protein